MLLGAPPLSIVKPANPPLGSGALGSGVQLVGSVPTGSLCGPGNEAHSTAAMAGPGGLPPAGAAHGGLSHQGSLRRRSKAEIAELLQGNLRGRGMAVDQKLAAELLEHFESLPSR